MSGPLVVSARVVIPAAELAWTAVRASGPGGQNVNKVASKVELRFDLANTQALSPSVKARLGQLAENRLDADGCILITSQLTRDQHQNLEDAREKLADSDPPRAGRAQAPASDAPYTLFAEEARRTEAQALGEEAGARPRPARRLTAHKLRPEGKRAMLVFMRGGTVAGGLLLAVLSLASGCGTDCAKLRQQAKALTQEYAACSAGDACQVVDMYEIAGQDNCLTWFQCSAPVRQGADLAAFKKRARALVDEYKSGCNICAIASCAPHQTAQCNTTTGRCEFVP